MDSYKYLKEKKSTNGRLKKTKTKKNAIATVQNLGEKKKAHYTKRGIVEALPFLI